MQLLFSSKSFTLLRKFGRYIGINKLIRPLLDLRGYQTNFDQNMINSLKKNDIFWDIGTNHGEIVKKVKYIFGNFINCVAFEPHPTLSANLKKLNFENFKVIDAALSNFVGKAEFVYGSDIFQTTGKLKSGTNDTQKTEVKVIDFKYALKVLNLETPNVIKIDVEGHEYEVLSSILENINNLRTLRAIFVEIHMSILDERKLALQMYKLIQRFEIETNLKLKWIDISHFKLER